MLRLIYCLKDFRINSLKNYNSLNFTCFIYENEIRALIIIIFRYVYLTCRRFYDLKNLCGVKHRFFYNNQANGLCNGKWNTEGVINVLSSQ